MADETPQNATEVVPEVPDVLDDEAVVAAVDDLSVTKDAEGVEEEAGETEEKESEEKTVVDKEGGGEEERDVLADLEPSGSECSDEPASDSEGANDPLPEVDDDDSTNEASVPEVPVADVEEASKPEKEADTAVPESGEDGDKAEDAKAPEAETDADADADADTDTPTPTEAEAEAAVAVTASASSSKKLVGEATSQPTVATGDPVAAACDLARRVPPTELTETVEIACRAVNNDDVAADILEAIDTPLLIGQCHTGREFIACEWNRFNATYRSPFSNKYQQVAGAPVLPTTGEDGEHGEVLEGALRQQEVILNGLIDSYRRMYYHRDGGVSSAYVYTDPNEAVIGSSFCAAVLFKISLESSMEGSWDAAHIVNVRESKDGKTASYSSSSSVILIIGEKGDGTSTVLGGSLTREFTSEHKLDDALFSVQEQHGRNVGRLIESAESQLRETMDEVHFSKAIGGLTDVHVAERTSDIRARYANQGAVANAMMAALGGGRQ